MTSISTVPNQETQQTKAGFWRKTGGVTAGLAANTVACGALMAPVALKIGKGMSALSNLSADEVKLLNKAGEVVLEHSGLVAKGVTIQRGLKGQERKAVLLLSESLKNMKISKKIRNKLKAQLPIYQILLGRNAAFVPQTNNIIMPKRGMELTQFHEIGHAMNANIGKFSKVLQKTRFAAPLLSMFALGVALFKNKKADGEQPTGFWDKTTTFVKNHAGKLAFLGFVPMVAEEALASHRGVKELMSLNPSTHKSVVDFAKGYVGKIKKANKLGLISYATLAVAFGVSTMIAGKVRDAIVQPEAKNE